MLFRNQLGNTTCNGNAICDHFRYLNRVLLKESQNRESNIQELNITLQNQSKEIETLKSENQNIYSQMGTLWQHIGNLNICFSYYILFTA